MYPARFAHHSLDAFGVILEALRLGDAIARELPRGYGKLSDQLRRALLGAYLQFTEAAAREGADRNSRLRCARAEAGESAAALEAVGRLRASRAQPPPRRRTATATQTRHPAPNAGPRLASLIRATIATHVQTLEIPQAPNQASDAAGVV